MSDDQGKNIIFKYNPNEVTGGEASPASSVPKGNPYGSGGGLGSGRNNGWNIGFGGNGGGRGEGGRPGTLSGSKRRRLRIQDKLRREHEARQQEEANRQAAAQAAQAQHEADARAVAESQARAHAEALAREHAVAVAEAQARAHAEAVARAAAEAEARAEQERVQAAHSEAVETVTRIYRVKKAELERQHAESKAALASALETEVRAGLHRPEAILKGVQQLDAILEEKARINYLMTEKLKVSESRALSAQSFSGADPLTINDEQFEAILLARSSTAEQVHETQAHWEKAYTDALEAKILASSLPLLDDRSGNLSELYAKTSWAIDIEVSEALEGGSATSLRHLSEANRLWSVIAGPIASPQDAPPIRERATEVARRLFEAQAIKLLKRSLSRIALFYPAELDNGELGPAILATPASKLGVLPSTDLAFIASRNGTIDVSHRLRMNETEGEPRIEWVVADGVEVGSKVRVRTFTYNPEAKRYEFFRDGDTKPSLIWTPAVTPETSSTVSPIAIPQTPVLPGTALSPTLNELGDYPTYDLEDFEEYVVEFPADSGLDPVYVMFKSPRYLPGIVSGMGGNIDPEWQTSATQNLGAPIPSVVADALRGRQYAEFRNLKRAIWREMSKHPEVTSGMNDRNIELIKQGKSPVAPRSERKGGRLWYEIHHIKPISKGGDVYGVDNLGVNSPANHDKIHSELRSQESH